ncbi:hypothetical protein [Halobacteriovorax marinus]|uniref:hypothetical protein n=1 Tax=Halobacteriovorax marinus TaxID=97084 RepID=UPI003A8D6D31
MHFNRKVATLVTLAVLPLSAFANSGLPMIVLGVPFMVILALPVIAIEYYFYNKNFNILSKSILLHTFIANVITTLIGYPLSWGILLGVQAVTGSLGVIPLDSISNIAKAIFFQAAWLIPHKDGMDWLIPACGLVGMIPAFITSYLFEKNILKKGFWESNEYFKGSIKSTHLFLSSFSISVASTAYICLNLRTHSKFK